MTVVRESGDDVENVPLPATSSSGGLNSAPDISLPEICELSLPSIVLTTCTYTLHPYCSIVNMTQNDCGTSCMGFKIPKSFHDSGFFVRSNGCK